MIPKPKNVLFFLLLISFSNFSFSLFSEPLKSPEIELMDNLICMTEKSLSAQEKIRAEIIDYQKVNLAFLKNPNDPELLFQMIQKASFLFERMKEAHLVDNFSLEFIKELTLFSNILKKKEEVTPTLGIEF